MKDFKGHGSNGRGRKPLPGHAYHKKTNEQLRYVIKDASEAARSTRGMTSYNPSSGKREDTEGKYLDQVNDAATVLGYRDRTGAGPDNADAAAALGQGHPKSEGVDTHASMTASIDRGHRMRMAGDGGHVPGYNPSAVNDAISSSNRAGRRIGGKEASAIHRLLKGRH